MDKQELIERLAKQSHQSKGKAADRVDKLVYGLLKELKQTQNSPSKTVNSAPKPPVAPSAPAGKGKK